jgi:hypothetical protein
VASNDANCIGYQVGVAALTAAGTYSTTVIYTAYPDLLGPPGSNNVQIA